MKIHWKKTTIMFILAVSLVIPSASFHVAADEKYSQSFTLSRYQLTESLQVDVKSVLNEPTTEGTKIGAVVRYYNAGERLVGVPEYEVRVKTNEGLEYIMRPSQANARNIQPKETIELSYLNVVDRYDEFALNELSWSDVDEFVYPKVEKENYLFAYHGSGVERGESESIRPCSNQAVAGYVHNPYAYGQNSISTSELE